MTLASEDFLSKVHHDQSLIWLPFVLRLAHTNLYNLEIVQGVKQYFPFSKKLAVRWNICKTVVEFYLLWVELNVNYKYRILHKHLSRLLTQRSWQETQVLNNKTSTLVKFVYLLSWNQSTSETFKYLLLLLCLAEIFDGEE